MGTFNAGWARRFGLPTRTSDILARVASRYAQCHTYADSGSSKLAFGVTELDCKLELSFTTAFVRPDRFRFESKNSNNKEKIGCVVWCRGDDIRTWVDVMARFDRPHTLDLALVDVVGHMAGSPYTTPALLLPHEFGGPLTDRLGGTRVRLRRLEGVERIRVDGEHHGSSITLWIDPTSLLVRRIDCTRRLAAASIYMATTTICEPIIDGPIPSEALLPPIDEAGRERQPSPSNQSERLKLYAAICESGAKILGPPILVAHNEPLLETDALTGASQVRLRRRNGGSSPGH